MVKVKNSLLLAGALALVLAGWMLIDRSKIEGNGQVAAQEDGSSIDAVWFEPDVRNAVSPNVETAFAIDVDRLHDLSYEDDAALEEFADSVGLTTACVIAVVKVHLGGPRGDTGECQRDDDAANNQKVLLPGEYESICRNVGVSRHCRRIRVADHPYEKYSDEELTALAETSPEASVILARRLENDLQSEKYYERAVALSGRPGPLEEWMLHRNKGGLVRVNGQLDLEKALVGYEVYLTTSRLGYGESAAKGFERVLTLEGVDLTDVHARADRRFERLTRLRRETTGHQLWRAGS